MEKRLVVQIHPFLMQQEIKVYEGKNEAKTFTSTLQELVHTIESVCDNYGIEDVVLSGMPAYTHRYANQIASNKFSNKAIRISVL